MPLVAGRLARGGSSAGVGFSRLFFCVYLARQSFAFPDGLVVPADTTGASLTTALLARETAAHFLRTDLAPKKWLAHVQQLYGMSLAWEHPYSDEECPTLEDMWCRAWWDGKLRALSEPIGTHLKGSIFRSSVTVADLFCNAHTTLKSCVGESVRFQTQYSYTRDGFRCDGNFPSDELLTYEVASKHYATMKLSLIFRVERSVAPVPELWNVDDLQPMEVDTTMDVILAAPETIGGVMERTRLGFGDFDYAHRKKAVRIVGKCVLFIIPDASVNPDQYDMQNVLFNAVDGPAICMIELPSEDEAVVAALQLQRNFFHIRGQKTLYSVSERVVKAATCLEARTESCELVSPQTLRELLDSDSWLECPFLERGKEILGALH